ncbi:MAG: hypothetical protein KAR05_10475 [Candidatus Omnitrophica bacterium]|nr:hypothetical protein [Candidatus Omnitrophota bacterium]
MARKIFCAFILTFCLMSSARAQLLIEKGKTRQDIEPGTTVFDTISVHNTSKKKLDVKVYWQDFEYVAPYYDGAKEFLPPGTSSRSLAGWVTIKPTSFSLPPQASREVAYSIKVPKYIKGGYNGIMFFELDAQKPDERLGVSIVTRIGSLFFLDSIDRDKTVKLEKFKIEDGSLAGAFINAGDIIMIPDVTYFILNREGMVEDRGGLRKFYLPPEKKAEFQLSLNKELKPGKYSIILTFDLGDGDSLVREIDILKMPQGAIKLLTVRE